MSLFKFRQLAACFALCVVVPASHAATVEQMPGHLIFISDPQYPWSDLTDKNVPDPNKDERSRELIGLQYSDVASFRQLNGGAARIPVMINGDITAFGHGGQRSYMKSVFEDKLGGLYDYGLGNHDYANNVDDSFLNNCAAGSVNDLKARYWGKASSMDLSVRGAVLGASHYSGSLAYSKDFGDVHMVQLNNEPTYAVKFSGGNPITPTVYDITPSLDWLERDLKAAREQGKIIILNMHKVFDWAGSDEQIARFRGMIAKYQVTAVFGGHDHFVSGSYYSGTKHDYFGQVPVFMSGAASQQTYLIASFSRDRKELNVNVVRNSNWPSRKLDKTIPVLK
ncbi:metallophosphoesterase [Pseudomonas sp.]|uniref:metallophosphoesterase family protein n=1 Tax=Pseudomonas sp. TaxID=306 RepID=UPI00286ABB37|nr:metallophosphoesterase [Pseudomonas sp.]